MRKYWASRLFKIGFFMFVLGCGPLLAIIGLAAIGLWPDPNPNPVGPGMLAFLTFWPSIICVGVAIGRVNAQSRGGGAAKG